MLMGAAPPPSNGYEAMRAADLRLATVGDRLARASVARCADTVFDAGLVLHRIDQYQPADRPAIAAYFFMLKGPSVLAVIPGGPADKAGIRANDAIRSVDGVAMPDTISAKASPNNFEAALDIIDKAMADGEAEFVLDRAPDSVPTIKVKGIKRCHVRFQMVPDDTLKASTNGLNLKISSAVLELAQNDDELAAMVAHEFAHVILKHPQNLRADGVKQGSLFAGFGKSGKKIRAAEEAADRLSIHLLYEAGYDMRAALRIWPRYIGRTVGPIGLDLTHGGASKRMKTMEEEIVKIEAPRR